MYIFYTHKYQKHVTNHIALSSTCKATHCMVAIWRRQGSWLDYSVQLDFAHSFLQCLHWNHLLFYSVRPVCMWRVAQRSRSYCLQFQVLVGRNWTRKMAITITAIQVETTSESGTTFSYGEHKDVQRIYSKNYNCFHIRSVIGAGCRETMYSLHDTCMWLYVAWSPSWVVSKITLGW